MNIKLSSLNKGLVGHWTMSQDSLKGSLLADKTPYSNDGTIYGATFTTDRMGQPNKAMYFDGVDDYINCGNDSSLNISGNIALSVWIFPKNKNNNSSMDIIAKRSTLNNDEYEFYLSSDFRLKFDRYLPSGGSVSSVCAVLPDKWQHIVIIKNELEEKVKFYINGILDSILPYTEKYTGNNSSFVTIGRSGVDSTDGTSDPWRSFFGFIDDVRIYNRALSEQEIKTLYNSYNPNIKMKTSLPKIKLYGGINNK